MRSGGAGAAAATSMSDRSADDAVASTGGGSSTAGVFGKQLPWLSMMSDFLCMDPNKWTDAAITIQGSPGFLHTVYLNPSLRPAFEQAFGGLEGLFSALFHHLLRPQRAIVGQAHAFIGELLTKAVPLPHANENGDAAAADAPTSSASMVVGLHVRNGRDFRTRKLLGDEWQRLAGCARALVPTADGGQVSGAAEGKSSSYVPTRFAVATESGESRTAAAHALGEEAAFYSEPLPKGKDGGTTSREGAKRALLELLIVAMSNVTLLTPMSSFSETVAALNGRPGIYFHFDLTRKVLYAHPPCHAMQIRRRWLCPLTCTAPVRFSFTSRALRRRSLVASCLGQRRCQAQ